MKNIRSFERNGSPGIGLDSSLKKYLPHRTTRGFSLVELLITLAIMLILMSMLMGRSSGSRQRRDVGTCSKNLQAIFTALTIYSTDNAGKYPAASNPTTSEEPLSLLIPRSTTGTEFFICPGANDSDLPQAEPFARRKISYGYYMSWTKNTASPSAPLVSDRQVNALPKKVGERLFSGDGKAPGANHHKYGGNVLFQSGEIHLSPTNSKFDLLFPTNVVFLNPKP